VQHQKPALPPGTVVGQQLTVLQQTRSGPLPSPEDLARYDMVLPGCAERILRMAEANSAHRHRIEQMAVGGNVTAQLRGQIFAFVLALAILGLAGWLFHIGREIAGVGLVLIEIGGLATVFITGKRQQASEREAKRKKLEAAVQPSGRVVPTPPNESS
jgi:uncharacterized membrane protein